MPPRNSRIPTFIVQTAKPREKFGCAWQLLSYGRVGPLTVNYDLGYLGQVLPQSRTERVGYSSLA